MFNNDVRLALAANNAGENAVKQYGNRIPPNPETRKYVKKVLAYLQQYQKTPKS
jgi:soluble lytic murein transglycosylase-like protein